MFNFMHYAVPATQVALLVAIGLSGLSITVRSIVALVIDYEKPYRPIARLFKDFRYIFSTSVAVGFLYFSTLTAAKMLNN